MSKVDNSTTTLPPTLPLRFVVDFPVVDLWLTFRTTELIC